MRASIGTDLSPRKRVFFREARSCRGDGILLSFCRELVFFCLSRPSFTGFLRPINES